MTIDANANAEVVALADMFVATALGVSLGITLSKIHYPKIDMTAASLRPCVLIESTEGASERYAEMGVAGNPVGVLTAVLIADPSVSIAQMETYGRTFKHQLSALSTGLPVRSISAELSSDMNPGQRAAEDTTADAQAGYRSVRFTISWGLSS